MTFTLGKKPGVFLINIHYVHKNFVHITRNSAFCISLIPRLLMLKLWLTIISIILKLCEHVKQEIILDKNRDHAPLKSTGIECKQSIPTNNNVLS